MATNFPTSLDTLTNPSATDTLDSPPHDEQHADANDAIEALQAKVGVNSSAVTSSLDYRVTALEGAGAGMETSATPPVSPSDGDMWYDTDDGRTYVYYDDGTSQQWVEFGAPAVAHGKILQVVSTTKTDTFTASLGAGADTAITGFSATITPSSTSSTILVMVDAHMSDATDAYGRGAIRIYRGATSIGEGIGSGSRTTAFASSVILQANTTNVMNIAGTYLDSPATTSATTYTVHAVNAWSSTKTIGCNRAGNDADSALNTRPSSTITLMEVSA